jgi:hypothetical protein
MLAPHEEQARRNHSQTLQRLAERGGLGPNEMLAVMDGVDWGDIGATYPDPVANLAEVKRRAAAFGEPVKG